MSDSENVGYDPVNKPRHYNEHPSGLECIQITEHMNFCLGNAFKYIFRAGMKGCEIEDLNKALWYLNRELNKMTAPERWLPIPSHPKYEASTFGRIRMIGSSKTRKLAMLKNGYLTFCIMENGKMKCLYVHRIVAETFLGDSNLCVCHKDGDRTNNKWFNLRYDTVKGNLRDRRIHGTHFFGDQNPSARLTEDEVQKIRELFGTMSEKAAGAMFNVSRSCVHRIWNKSAWNFSDVAIPIDLLIEHEVDMFKAELFSLLWSVHTHGRIDNLEKAVWYIQREIQNRSGVSMKK